MRHETAAREDKGRPRSELEETDAPEELARRVREDRGDGEFEVKLPKLETQTESLPLPRVEVRQETIVTSRIDIKTGRDTARDTTCH